MIADNPSTTGIPWLIVFGSISVLVALAFVCYTVPLLIRALQISRWRKRAPNLLALTYDDGPDDTTTPAVLELLQELGVQATFYLVGFRAERNPQVAATLRASGHELGAQSHLHKHAWKIGPVLELYDATRAYRVLSGVVETTASYRPPFGKISLPTLIVMSARSRKIDWWTAASNDTRDDLPDPTITARRLLDSGGPVILMHSHHIEPHRRTFVLELTRELVLQGRERGRVFATVSQVREAAA